MGKGKKGGKGTNPAPKEEDPAIGSLTLSESQPSTSTSAEAVAPKPAEPVPAPKDDDEDEGGLGLGLGKSKKKRPKKKKESAPPAEPVSASSQPVATASGPVTGSAWPPPQQTLPGQQPPGFPQPVASASAPVTGSQRPPYQQTQSQTAFPTQPPGFPSPQSPGYPQPGRSFAHPQGTQDQPSLPYQQPPAQQHRPGFPQQQQRGAGRGWRGQEQAASVGQSLPQPTPPVTTQAPRQAQPIPTQQGPSTIPQPKPEQTPSPQGGSRQTTPSETGARLRIIPPKYPGSGKVLCRKISVLANYLPMTIKPLKIHRYDVTITPERPKKMIPRAFVEVKRKYFPQHLIAFDQMKNCYCLHPLPNVPQHDRLSTKVELLDNNDRPISFEISFKATGIVDLSTILNYMRTGGTSLNPPTEAIQCIDVILRQGTLENYIKAGRQFFKRPMNPIDLGDGLEMWTGLFQSAIFTSTAFINIDVAHKGFPRQQPLVKAVVDDFRLDPRVPITSQRGRGVENFTNFIKNLRVIAKVGGDVTKSGQKREFICNELVRPASQMTFTLNTPDGKQIAMSVADYFTKVKGIRLQYPDQNCMWVGPRDKNIYYPLELLEVSYGQALNKQLNENQLSTMVRQAATPPDERKRKIHEVMGDMKYHINPDFKKFGLEISNEFVKVPARVLKPPDLDVGLSRSIQPSRGVWQAKRLLKPEALECWGLVGIELNVQGCNGEQIIALMKSTGIELGMRVSDPRPGDRFYNTRLADLRDVLISAVQKNLRFLVIVVPTRGRDYYHKVKQIAERDVGILTQCIKEMTATRRMNPQTARNILLKVNSKLMGVNQALSRSCMPRCLADGGVMVVGADVTHPSPDQSSVPSIAAVTASIDTKCFVYNIQLSIQTPKKEMIVEFEDMMVEHLRIYTKNQGVLPRKIFVYRDGVSEGQFAQVMNSELAAVHKAYQRLAGSQARPEVLFLLVQKRHHTRFFNVDQNNASYNVEPGTVVDTDIVHARELDFYLVSHQAIKGTARPTRYHAVCNDGQIPHDEVEQLTYYLCHLYSRCMRAVSYPTPTYYAHLACLRARSLTHGEKFNNQDLEKNPKRLRVLDRMLDFSRMFFV